MKIGDDVMTYLRKLVVISVLFLLPMIAWAADVAVTGVNVSTTQITLNVSGSPTYKFFILKNPDRLVVDIKDATLTAKLNNNLPANGIVTIVRSGSRENNDLRIVFELKEPTKFDISQLKNGRNYKLVFKYKNVDDVVMPQPVYLTSSSSLSMIPQLYLEGNTGTNLIGQADAVIPLMLQANKALFIYGQGEYANVDEDWLDNPWTGSFRCWI